MICRSVFSFLFLSALPSLAASEPVPLFPNSDFEAGTLANWTPSGAAFIRQPTRGDNTAARGNVPCGLQGNYWIGTYENYDGVTGAPGDTRTDAPVGTLTSQSFTIQKRYITFLMGGGNRPGLTGVKLICEGQEYPMATGVNSESMVPFTFDAQALAGKSATLVIFDQATGDWGHINADHFQASDEPAPIGFRLTPGIPSADSPAIGYDQQHRPQFHFTSRRNWLNDPNGMVFDGEKYHFFFQHNPLSPDWGNMTWGHAVSTDMIHWRQVDHALLPYQVEGRSGTIFSGSAVVDHNNSLGVQVSSRKTLAAFFTYAHEPFYQALAYSTDGGVTWDYHDHGRAVVPNQGFDAGERDPKVFWHEASQKWVMVLWVQSTGRVRFFTSTNLKDWTFASDLMRSWAFECMDMFPLPVDGNPAQTKWVIYDASFDYEIGSFNGTTFVTEAGPFKASKGNFYAAQSFNQAPNGRVVQIGWMNGGPNSASAYGVPFNQQMSFPCELSLRTTPDGVRLCANPVSEISSLVTSTHQVADQPITSSNLLTGIGGLDLVDLSMEFEPRTATQIVIDLPRTTVRYDVPSSTLTFTDVNGNPSSLVDGAVTQRAGRVKLRLLLDRLSLEGYAFDGEKFGSHYLNPNNGTTTPSIHAVGGQGWVNSLSVKKLASAWTPEPPLSTTLVNPGFDDGIPSGGSYQDTVPGWTTFGDWAGAAGRWDDSGNALTQAAGYPDFTGLGAASLKARNAASENRGGLFQSLGRVALTDIGKTYTLGADLGARITDGEGNYAHTGELTVSFRKGVTSGVSGDGGTLLGTAGTRTVTADDAALPSLVSVKPVRVTATFTPGIEDVGTEVFAMIDLKNLSASASATNGEKQYLADNVTLSTEVPPPPAGLLAYEGFDYGSGSPSLGGGEGGYGWAAPWVTVANGSADVAAGNLTGGARVPAGFDVASVGNKCVLPNDRRIGRFLDTRLNGPFGAHGLVDANGRIGKDGSRLYLSFLQQPNGTSLFYEFEFHRGNLGDDGRIAGIGNDQPGDNVYLRAPNGNHTLIGAGDTGVNFYVVRIDFKAGNDDVRIYRNPTSATEPGVPTLIRANATDMSFDGISFGAFLNGRTVAHDEIRMGTSWADVIAEDPYTTWVRESGLLAAGGSNTDFDDDPDHDAIPNGLEWILNGNPLASDAAPLWSATAEDGLTVTFDRNPDSTGHAGLFLQWTTSLNGSWNDVPIQQGDGPDANGVVVSSNGNTVTVHVPGHNAQQGKLFARLRAVGE